MLEMAAEEVECLCPPRGGLVLVPVVSSVMVLDGEPGDGGLLACEDLGEFRADKEKELRRRP